MYTINQLKEMYGGETKVLFYVTEESAHTVARVKLKLKRDLTDDELHSVAKGLEFGLGDDMDVSLKVAVEESYEPFDEERREGTPA